MEPPFLLHENVYLGCSQKFLQPDLKMIAQKHEMVQRICHSSAYGTPDTTSGRDLQNSCSNAPISSSTSKSEKKKQKSNTWNADSQRAFTAARDPKWLQDGKISSYADEMFRRVKQTVDRYLELAGKTKDSLKKFATPCMHDHQIPPEEFQVEGELSPIAARVVLKTLYVARIARMDLMWAVNMLAREVTRWTAACGRRLHRLISSMHHSRDWAQICYVGDSPSKCDTVLFSDASFAGDLRDSKSTSGGVLCLVGPNTFVPISWLGKKQTAVSHSTSEAEVIALDDGTRLEGLPVLLLWTSSLRCLKPPESRPLRRN